MADKDLNQRLQLLAGLVGELESIADPKSRATAREVVQLIMDLHSAALERILEKMFAEGETGQRVIDQLGADPLISSLLVLYGLHPEELATRVARGLQRVSSELRSHHVSAELVGIENGEVRVRAAVGANACGSTAGTARTLIENAIYEVAPDVTSLLIDGLEGKQASSFVSLEKLMGCESSGLVRGSVSAKDERMQEATGD
jgi:Fe-S cluster biogenesis protein NfuA